YEENVNTGDIVGIGFNVNDNIGIASTDFNISTNGTAELTKDGNWYNYTLNVPVDSVNDIDFNATFSDAAGNFNSTDDISVNVSDNIDPVIQDIVYEENVNTGDIVGIGFNVNDNIGIASTDFNISTNGTAELTKDGNWYNYTLNVPLDSVDDIVFNATFSDTSGNYNTSNDKTINVTDNIAPVIQDIVYEENANTGDIVGIGFNVNDNIGIASTDFNISTNETAELTEDGNWYNYTLNVPLDSVDDIVFNATFSDTSGNYNTSSDKTINVTDNIAPVIQDIVYEENANTGDIVGIGFNVNDNIGITSTDFNISTNETAELTEDGNWYNYTLNVPVDSVNDIDFNATFSDAAGNFNSTDDISVNVSDNIDPVIQDIVYEENVNTGDIVGIGFNVNDNIGIASTDFNISTNGTAELTKDGNWYNYSLHVPVDSINDIDFNATFSDTAGNSNATDDKTISVTDNIAPVIQDIVYEEDVNTGDVVAIGFNVTDHIGITSTDFNISTNGTAELTKGGNWYNYTLTVPEDSVDDIVFNATFSDAAGNSNATDDITVNVSDNIKPSYNWFNKVESANTGDNITIKLNATDNIGVETYNITVDGDEYQMKEDSGNYTHNISIPASDSGTLVSSITYNCTFGDAAGNLNSTGNTVINVSVLPIANFSANVTRGTTPLSVEFSDNSSGLVKSWNWDFGDGNTSTEQNPSHVFGSGNFTVNLTVENNNGTSTKHLNIRAADEPVYVVSPNETELLSKYGEEMNFSINNTLFSSYEWFIDGTPLNGSGVTLHNNNTDDSAHLSYCNVNTSQYIDQDDFFMDVYNISAHVSNESLERTDVFSWEWTVTNSSAKQGDEIDHLINKTPEEVTKIGSESHVRFNTSNETSEKTGIECSINMVSFNTSNETDDIQIKIEVLNTSALNESEIDFSKGSVYQYMDISFNNESLVNEGSNNRSIEFKVYNEVNGGTLLINTVYLRHKDTSGWEAYKPELLRNDGTYSHFIVRDIPSFSPYAVTADYEYDSATKSDDGLPAYLKWKMFKEQMEGSTEGDEVVDVEKPESEDTVSSQQPDSTDIPEDTNKEDTTTADGDNNLAAMCIGLLGLIAILLIISKRKEK
ncbi:PKD domain-containing protein, partial [Methanohalophilus portucalensis]